MTSLSYAVPVYNEAEILDSTIGIFLRDLDSLADVIPEFELIVVDDASKDGSDEIAAAWAARDTRVRLIKHERNLGAGMGILSGLRAATKQWFVVNAADRPFDTRDTRVVAPHLPDADVVVVARTDRSANSPYRKLTSWVNYLLIRGVLGMPVDDCQFVQFYRTNLVQGLPIFSKGTLVPPELILRSWRRGARFRQVRLPFHARPGGYSKYGDPRHALRTVRDMFGLRLRFVREDLRL